MNIRQINGSFQTVQVSLGSLSGLLRVHGCEPGQKMFPVHYRTHSIGFWRGFDTQALALFPNEGICEGVLLVRAISGTITFVAVSSLNRWTLPRWAGTALRS